LTLRRAGALLFLFLSACGRNESGARVRFGIFQGAVVPHLALSLGYFTEEGLAVTFEELPGVAKLMEALLGGSADVITGTYEQAVQMAAEGREIRSFLTMLRCHGLVLAASPAGRIPVRRIEDLEGAVVGVTAPGSSTHFFVNYLLSKHGLRPGAVSAVGIGAGAGSVAALERGRVDAGVLMGNAFTLFRRRNPGAVILANTYSFEEVRRVFGVDTYPSSALLARAAWLEGNRSTARKLVAAMLKATRWAKAHTAEEVRERLPRAWRMEDAEADLEALRLLLALIPEDGAMTLESAEAVRRVVGVSLEKVRTARIDLSKTFTNEFLR
jgi:NitT/TauT family transport system substrate-binding protein